MPPSATDREKLLAALSVTPIAVDDLIATLRLPAGTMQTLMLELDLDGRIEWSSGQLVALRF